MPNDTVIKVENLSKQYRIGSARGGYKTFRETLVDAAKAPFQQLERLFNRQSPIVNRQSDDTIWALRDVSFEVKRGEVVGIIGRNGAGKSTLLKILSKITKPTEGRVELKGRVGSLLEVGTGFHPELTGHENVYMYGAILGMDRWEVTRKFDEIVAFAELEKFIETPVKRYSSGMYMRLAFAVAAHMETELLLVDEVLAVGDAAFQKKCLGKMDDIAREGRTVLFISHNMAAIVKLCQRALLLELGRIVTDGISSKSVEHYLRTVEKTSTEPFDKHIDRKGNQSLKFLAFELTDFNGNPIQYACSGQDIALTISYICDTTVPLKNVQIDIGVHGRFDENLFHLSTSTVDADFKEIPLVGKTICKIYNLPLQPGKYSFNLHCTVSGEISDWIKNAGTIEVEAGDFFNSGKLPPPGQGALLVKHSWSITPKNLNICKDKA